MLVLQFLPLFIRESYICNNRYIPKRDEVADEMYRLTLSHDDLNVPISPYPNNILSFLFIRNFPLHFLPWLIEVECAACVLDL